MAVINALSILDLPDKKIINFPQVALQTAPTSADSLTLPNVFATYTPQAVGNETRYTIPTTTEKFRRCDAIIKMQATIILTNSITGKAINQIAEIGLLLAALTFDSVAIQNQFLSDREIFEVNPSLRQMVLGVSTAVLRVNAINFYPETPVNNTKLNMAFTTPLISLGVILFRPSFIFYK